MKLPDKIFGKKVEGAYERFLKESEKEKPKEEPRIITPSSIQRDKYIQVPETNSLISKEEIYKGKTWDEIHYALTDNGLYMPTPALFMKHFLNVRDAFQNKNQLYDGNNNLIPKEEVEDLWKYLTSGHRGGCWTWLDAKFIEGSGALGLDILTNHEVVIKDSNKSLTPKTKKPLEQCVQEDCYADLDSINSQGLPIKKASSQDYKQGANIYFYHPRENKVARFYADSDGAGLDCIWDPGLSYSRLGVFACVEGTKKT